MADLVKIFDLLHQDVKSFKREIEDVKSSQKKVEQELNLVQQSLQSIKRRDILKFIMYKQPKLVEKHKKLSLKFVDREQSKKNHDSTLGLMIQKGNILAHDLTIKNVYASLTDPKTSDAIFKTLRKRLSKDVNLESFFQTSLVTLVAGVPNSLIQHALGKLKLYFFESLINFYRVVSSRDPFRH